MRGSAAWAGVARAVLCCDLKLDVSCCSLLLPVVALLLGFAAVVVLPVLLVPGQALCCCESCTVCCCIKGIHAIKVKDSTCVPHPGSSRSGEAGSGSNSSTAQVGSNAKQVSIVESVGQAKPCLLCRAQMGSAVSGLLL